MSQFRYGRQGDGLQTFVDARVVPVEGRVPRHGQKLGPADAMLGHGRREVRLDQLMREKTEIVDHLDHRAEAQVAHGADAVHQKDQVVHHRRFPVSDVETVQTAFHDQRPSLTILKCTNLFV